MASEGSAAQNRGLTNRNRISGILGRTSGRLTAKSQSINGQGCRSGRGAGKAIELTWGGLCHVPISELRAPRGVLTVTQKVEPIDSLAGTRLLSKWRSIGTEGAWYLPPQLGTTKLLPVVKAP